MVPQKLNVTLKFPYEIDDNLSVIEKLLNLMYYNSIEIEYLKVYYRVHTVKNSNKPIKMLEGNDKRGPCKFLNQFGGTLWYDIQLEAGLLPNTCPLPKVRSIFKKNVLLYIKSSTFVNVFCLQGQYNVINQTGNFRSLKTQRLPFDKLIIHTQWKEKTNNRMKFCAFLEVSRIN